MTSSDRIEGSERAERPLPVPGDLLGDYQIDSELGRGGLGIVYLATSRHVAIQRVAIKLLTLPVQGSATDLLREAQHLSRLDHPNVVRMLHVGIHRGLPYLVLEYLGEETLHRHLQEKGQLGMIDALRINLGIAKALEYLHSNHVLHCDIKPQNVVITEGGQPKLIDFGFARSLHSTSSEPFGTYTYAPLERHRTEKSDVYSAAMTLLACLAPTASGHAPARAVVAGLSVPGGLKRTLLNGTAESVHDRPHATAWRLQLERLTRNADRRRRMAELAGALTAALNAAAVFAIGGGVFTAEPEFVRDASSAAPLPSASEASTVPVVGAGGGGFAPARGRPGTGGAAPLRVADAGVPTTTKVATTLAAGGRGGTAGKPSKAEQMRRHKDRFGSDLGRDVGNESRH